MPDAPSPTDDGSRSVVIEERDVDGSSDDGARASVAGAEGPSGTPNQMLDPDPDAVVALVGEVSVIADDVRAVLDHPTGAGLPVDLARWADLAAASLNGLGASGELQLSFVDVDEIAELNQEHMGSNGPTDVLSFPIDGLEDESTTASASAGSRSAGGTALKPIDQSCPPRLLGDVVVCPEVAARNAPNHAGTVDDELALLVVHGVLHVLGYDHAEPAETERMRAQERELLIRHHWNGPVPVGFHHEHLDDRDDSVETGGMS